MIVLVRRRQVKIMEACSPMTLELSKTSALCPLEESLLTSFNASLDLPNDVHPTPGLWLDIEFQDTRFDTFLESGVKLCLLNVVLLLLGIKSTVGLEEFDDECSDVDGEDWRSIVKRERVGKRLVREDLWDWDWCRRVVGIGQEILMNDDDGKT